VKNHYIILILSLGLALLSASTVKASNNDSIAFQLEWEDPTFPYISLYTAYDELGRSYFYVANKGGGLSIYNDANQSNPQHIHTIPTSDFDSLEVMNMHQQGNFLYLALGNFFGDTAVRQAPGMAVVDITNPATAFVTDYWKSSTVTRGSSGIWTEGNYCYLAAMEDGLIIFDVTDENDILFTSQFVPDINIPVPNPTEVQMPNGRGLQWRNDTIFMCYDAGGLSIIDVSNKALPTEIIRYINAGALNVQQAYNNITLNGNLAYIALDYCGMEIIDISDVNNINQLSWWNPWGCETPQNLWFNSVGHTNQITLDPQEEIIFLSAGGSELRIVDVSNPSQPDSCSGYGVAFNALACWGATVHQDRVFLNYINSLFPYVGLWSGVKTIRWQVITDIEDFETETFKIHPAYPNPFSESTQIEFELQQPQTIQIEIYNALGKKVKTLAAEKFRTGRHSILWNGRSDTGQKLSAGIYYCKITSNESSFSLQLVKQ
jgi:hypothetical protein